MGSKTNGWRSLGRIDKGININSIDYSPEFSLHSDSKNVTSGIHKGLGPRYGMTPVPGHFGVAASGSEPDEDDLAGLREHEDNSDLNRVKYLGVVPLTFTDIETEKEKKQHYVWIFSFENSGTKRLGMDFGMFYDSGDGENRVQPAIDQPILMTRRIDNTSEGTPYYYSKLASNFYASASGFETWLENLQEVSSHPRSVSFATIAVTGKQVPCEWIVAINKAAATSARGGNYNINQFGSLFPFTQQKQNNDDEFYVEIHEIYNSKLQRIFYYNDVPASPDFFGRTRNIIDKTYVQIGAKDYFDSTANNADATAAGANNSDTYTTGQGHLIHVPGLKHSVNYQMVFATGDRPQGLFIREDCTSDQYIGSAIDPTKFFLSSCPTRPTTLPAGGKYTEDGDNRATCWAIWPAFVTGTALAKDSAASTSGSPVQQVTLGAANSGILRAGQVYEIAFSIYNKQLDFETNVGLPAKVQVATDDYVALSILRQSTAAGSVDTVPSFTGGLPFPFSAQNSSGYDAATGAEYGAYNYLEYRIYYRVLGSFEWLPAGNISFPEVYRRCNYKKIWICTGDAAGLPGGQPGGFVDYSTLPSDKYDDVKNFRDRVFWIGKNNIAYSLKGKPLCYPLRNTISSPTGFFRGATLHTYPGQSTQEGRMIVWGSKDVYVGRFTGNTLQQPVRVSSTEVGYFPLEGSDFELQQWTTHTAFSHRSAVVAEGYMYWWGPDGVYMDDGRDIPIKLSKELEPDIFTFYDPQKTDSIHCVYNSKTKEIIWFYEYPDGTTSKGLALNIESNEFFNLEFDCYVENSQYINIENDDSPEGISGNRTLLGISNSATGVSRPVFFDHRNRGGDLKIGQFMVFDGLTDNMDDTITLDLETSHDDFSHLEVGDKIHLHQATQYSGDTTSDCVGVITEFDNDASTGYVTISVPSGLTWGTPTSKFFAYHEDDSIDYIIKSEYFLPGTLNDAFLFRFLHMLFKLTVIPNEATETLSIGYRVPRWNGGAFAGRNSNLIVNSDEAMQLYHQLDGLNLDGQALQLLIQGSHLANEWVLQYIGAHIEQLDGELFLQDFEG